MKRWMVIAIGVIVGLLVVAGIVLGVAAWRNKGTGTAIPSNVANGPGSVAWEGACIYTNSLAVAEKDPANVCSLDLFSQNLTEIPASVFTMTNIEYLNLANNDIKDVPSDIGNLTRLKWLYLNQNPITVLPDSISKLKDLQMLAAEEDEITAMPSDMTGMANLQAIILQGNPLPPPEVTRVKTAFAKASVIY
ncbi:MAG: leucine-rich repeat domain-containing protein [Chthoniobacter sp.]|nr:leucine-rich repeat domain-containing protein [Chthoniobacter sp.]